MTTVSSETAITTPTNSDRSWPDYRAVWRWHFYAGLLCMPFVIVLSMSGSLYLFKPQIEAWNDRPYNNLAIKGPAASVADQVRAALAAVPDASLSAYEIPASAESAARVIVRQNGEPIRVYVHPETLEVLHTFPDNDRFTRFLFRLHGELLMGDRGSMLVELAASWTIIMIVTGLYLWWPRQQKGMGGILYVRSRSGSRIFWRDIHSVTGIWISGLALFLLLSGLPWAKSWGNYLKGVRRLTGTAVAQQDWTTGSDRKRTKAKESGGSGEHSGHGSGRRRGEETPLPKDLGAFDRVAATVQPLQLQPPVLIAPPARGAANWSAKSMTANRPQRVNLVVDGETGAIVSREDFKNRHLIDRIVAVGIAAHEGQLFGWPNQLLGLVTAGGLILISFSGVIMWVRRRSQGVLGAPNVLLNPRFSFGLLVACCCLWNLFAVVWNVAHRRLLVEKIILSRIPPVRRWLGLQAPTVKVAA